MFSNSASSREAPYPMDGRAVRTLEAEIFMASPASLIWKSFRPLVPASLVRAIRKILPRPLAAMEAETELSVFFNRATGELFPGFPISAKDTVLDVGCGTGGNSGFAAECGAEVIAVDVDPTCIAATTTVLQRWPGARFSVHLSDGHALPVANGRATRVLAQEVLEHVEKPEIFLAELYRAAAPGALLLITVPDPASEKVIKKISPAVCWQPPNHVHIYERERFAGMIRSTGLEVISHDWGSFYWSMWWILMWSSEVKHPVTFGASESKALHHWNKLWAELLKTPKGRAAREALEDAIPKSQRILARKPA